MPPSSKRIEATGNGIIDSYYRSVQRFVRAGCSAERRKLIAGAYSQRQNRLSVII